MHSLISILSFFTVLINPEHNRDSIPLLPQKVYKVTVKPMFSGSMHGYLQSVTDTSISVSKVPTKYMSGSKDIVIPYSDVKYYKYHKQGSIAKGMLYGLIGGVVLGGIIGAISYKPCESCFLDFGIGLDILAGSIIGIIPGMGIGGLIGSKREKVIINGKKEHVYKAAY
jgi:hypothetical protein